MILDLNDDFNKYYEKNVYKTLIWQWFIQSIWDFRVDAQYWKNLNVSLKIYLF